MTPGSRSTLRTVSHLLSVDAARRRHHTPIRNAAAYLIPLLNLFFCGYIEHLLENDDNGSSLSLFLFVESLAFITLSVTHHLGSTSGILQKSRIFPTTPDSRLTFSVCANLRKPDIALLSATNAFALAIVFRNSPGGMIAAPLFVVLLALILQCIISVSFLAADRTSSPRPAAVAVAVLVLFFLFSGSLLLETDVLLLSAPVLSWTAHGISSAANATWDKTALNASLNILLLVAVAVLGRRFA